MQRTLNIIILVQQKGGSMALRHMVEQHSLTTLICQSLDYGPQPSQLKRLNTNILLMKILARDHHCMHYISESNIKLTSKLNRLITNLTKLNY